MLTGVLTLYGRSW